VLKGVLFDKHAFVPSESTGWVCDECLLRASNPRRHLGGSKQPLIHPTQALPIGGRIAVASHVGLGFSPSTSLHSLCEPDYPRHWPCFALRDFSTPSCGAKQDQPAQEGGRRSLPRVRVSLGCSSDSQPCPLVPGVVGLSAVAALPSLARRAGRYARTAGGHSSQTLLPASRLRLPPSGLMVLCWVTGP
jgi:hypothetical protein